MALGDELYKQVTALATEPARYKAMKILTHRAFLLLLIVAQIGLKMITRASQFIRGSSTACIVRVDRCLRAATQGVGFKLTPQSVRQRGVWTLPGEG
jgi:hypothetical protein